MKRLLLVEDDPSIRRYVALALEDEGLDTLDEAGTLQSALACLRERSYDLVLTDLMLPDGHGTDLLEALRDDPALRQGAQLVAFSAGVAPSMRQRLFDLGAARILEKPVSLQALLDCVRAVAPAQAASTGADTEGETFAVERHFGGQRSLFDEFKAGAQQQFLADLAEGDRLLLGNDVRAVRRLSHSLKSVMRLLGRNDAAARAAALEHSAQQPGATMPALHEGWQRLRSDLV